MSDGERRVAIIFADMREARPLVRYWSRLNSSWLPKTAEAFQKGNTISVVAGMGPKHAAATARAVIEEFSPDLIVSAGFAGAIAENLEPPVVLRPTRVVNGVTGQIYEIATASPGVTLVSSDHVVNEEGKRVLARLHSAAAVDMEGATVAEIAQAAGIRFSGVKVISERADFPMPPFDSFIGDDGCLRIGAFLRWAAVHPKYWVPMIQLARNSATAAEALAEELRRL